MFFAKAFAFFEELAPKEQETPRVDLSFLIKDLSVYEGLLGLQSLTSTPILNQPPEGSVPDDSSSFNFTILDLYTEIGNLLYASTAPESSPVYNFTRVHRSALAMRPAVDPGFLFI